MTREIPLTRGMVSIVDDEDYDRLVAMGKWQAFSHGRTHYARKSIWLGGKRFSAIQMHGVITGLSYVDHANGDGLDNRRANLRAATRSQNMGNRRTQANLSGYKGVTPFRGGKWHARIQVDGKERSLGYYTTPEEAALAYDAAARIAWGEYARPNFPERTR